MDEKVLEICNKLNRIQITVSEAHEQLLSLFSVMPRSYGIVRWYDNVEEDVVCVDRATAEDYVAKYNKLAGDEKCYVDEDIWLPLNEA
jgi:hypothetical protein